MSVQSFAFTHRLTPILGFESTDYALQGERIVWIGDDGAVRHPRNYWNPWQAPSKTYSAALLKAGAALCIKQLHSNPPNKGLLAWLAGGSLAFPMEAAKPRFDAVREALQAKQIKAFEMAALRVIGLGNGLTPSGDDFLGGIFFALHHINDPAHKAHSAWLSSWPSAWLADLPALKATLLKACGDATNPISTALLADNMAGESYGQLHDMLDAFESNDSRFIAAATQALHRLGASSGADLLAGLLLALTLL